MNDPKININIDALLESIAEGIVITDPTGNILRINAAALSIIGFGEEEVVGKWFPDVVIAEDFNGKRLSSFERPMGQVFSKNKSVTARAYYRHKNGSKIPVSLTVSPVVVNSKPVGVVEVFRDISYELNVEQAKDEFVAIASHQLRTPATAVRQYLSLLLEGYAEPVTEGQKHFLERAFESNERQLHIVEEILKITQLDLEKVVLKPAVYDLLEIVEEAGASLQNNLQKKSQKLVIKSPKEPVKAQVDKDQLRVAIENLLENASNYTWEDKTITVRLKKVKNKVRILIEDQGVGIDAADYSRLFKKFSRIPNPLSVEIGGTGLGLYWAAKIVHMHGGYISVKSKVGEGTVFTIIMPDGL